MTKIRLAVIGTGMAWERLHLPALKELSDYYEIVALSNDNEDRLVQAANEIGLTTDHIYTNYHDMLKGEEIDVVNIAVPIEMNYLVSEEVAKAGFNIICEKPLAPSLDQAEDYLKLQSKYGVKILIAENFRYNEENTIIRDLINDNKIGDVLYFIKNNVSNFEDAMVKDTFAAKEWRQHPEFKGGVILDASVHDIATLEFIFGEVESVSAFGVPLKEDYAPYSVINSIMLFKSGLIGTYNYCLKGKELQYPLVGFRIFGTEGTIYLEDRMCGAINVMYKKDNKHEIYNYTPDRGYYNEFKNFYDALTADVDVAVPPNVEIQDARIVFTILKSANKKKALTVD
ncbi:MAG: oxidoreductase [Firmicutes bacterium HGW-Firmicutes-1]|jgi:predicted dehydrogenase|nr:MAG: oxidoreductase [Firmicutes bacterium HGW-Firmicutes-1]